MRVAPNRIRLRLLTSSIRKKRAALGVALVSVAVLGAERQKPVPVVRLPRVTFNQLDVEFDGDRHQKSAWGAADLRFVGSSHVMYFNLSVVSGNSSTPVWRVQNVPVLSREGSGVAQTTTFHFNLGNTPGDRVTSLQYGFALTDTVLTEMPAVELHGHVNRTDYAIDTGYAGIPIVFQPPPDAFVGGAAGFAAPPQALVGAAVAAGPCSHEGFPNIDVGKDECVPGAVSNSLNWMNELYGLGISVNDITLEAMKTATGWKAENKGCGLFWSDKKKAYLEEHDIPVSTEEVDAFRIGRILDAVCAGCDVEIGIGEHCVAVTGAVKLENGNYSFDLTHDSDQKHPGGTITETATWNNALGQFQGGPDVQNKTIEFIVVECPIGSPTPTPTPSDTPTHTRTPTPAPSGTPSRTPTPPPGATSTPTNTPTTPAPSATATNTATSTPAPPTSTATATATNTPVPPTSTFTSSPTATPTNTPSNTPTNTPTGTATPTPTPSTTPTPTPSTLWDPRELPTPTPLPPG
jgi:hypothetical protein